MLGTRILDSFRTAFSRGLFKVLAVVLKDMPRPRAHVSDLFQALAVYFAGHATASFPCFLSHLSGCRHRRTVDIAACRGYIWRFCGVFLRVPGIKIVSLPPPRFLHFYGRWCLKAVFRAPHICPSQPCAAILELITDWQRFNLSFFSVLFFFYLQSRRGQEAWIGPKVLPSGLPRYTVPPRVTQLLQAAMERGEGDRLSASFTVAQTIAKDSNYELKVTSPTTRQYACTNGYYRLRR